MTPAELWKRNLAGAAAAAKRGETLTPGARVMAARFLRDEAQAALRAADDGLHDAIAEWRASADTDPGTYWTETNGRMVSTDLPTTCTDVDPDGCCCGAPAVSWDETGEGYCVEHAPRAPSLAEKFPDLFKSLPPDEFARRVAAMDTPEERAKLEALLKMPDVPPNGMRF